MSWTDIFPILSDDDVAAYQKSVTADEASMLEELFGVHRTVNARWSKHLVSSCLFWKPANSSEADFCTPDRKSLLEAGENGNYSRHLPWAHYVRPLLDGAETLRSTRPDIVFRVYLAADLEFLIEDLVAAGCEVMLMKGSSLRHNPGAMWRFLAFEEEDRLITVCDADRACEVLHDVERTENALSAGHGLWRIPYVLDGGAPDNDPGFYRPINACQFGGRSGLPMSVLMKAMVWHVLRGTMPDFCRIGAIGEQAGRIPSFGSDWPSYGFDEWFLLTAFYPRMAMSGVLTFVGWNDRTVSQWLAIDLEYVTWANPISEMINHGSMSLFERLRIIRETKKAESRILQTRIEQKREEQSFKTAPAAADDERPATLVIARYEENLNWLKDLPDNLTVILYNKGSRILNRKAIDRIDRLIDLPNIGREADTYLHHLESHAHDASEGWTVFCQGDPFPHSPDFIGLLHSRSAWNDIQPLTSGYLKETNIPPSNLRETNDRDWLGNIPLYTEYCSSHTLDMNAWQDEGGRQIFRDYIQHHRLPRGWSISGHFLECCGLDNLAAEAWDAEMLRFCYGAIFAVRNSRLELIPKDCLPAMRRMAQGHYAHGYVFEKLWLHLFGLPFVRVSGVGLQAYDRSEKQPPMSSGSPHRISNDRRGGPLLAGCHRAAPTSAIRNNS